MDRSCRRGVLHVTTRSVASAVTATALVALAALCVALHALGTLPLTIAAVPLAALTLTWPAQAATVRLKARNTTPTPTSPNPRRLAAEARTARQHARDHDLPTDPWTQLEAFWGYTGDLPLAIDPVLASPADLPHEDPFTAELTAVMLAPIAPTNPEPATTDTDADEPFNLDAFLRRTTQRLTDDRPDRRPRREASPSDRDHVQIVNGAGQIAATYVRHTWTLTGTDEETPTCYTRCASAASPSASKPSTAPNTPTSPDTATPSQPPEPTTPPATDIATPTRRPTS